MYSKMPTEKYFDGLGGQLHGDIHIFTSIIVNPISCERLQDQWYSGLEKSMISQNQIYFNLTVS